MAESHSTGEIRMCVHNFSIQELKGLERRELRNRCEIATGD